MIEPTIPKAQSRATKPKTPAAGADAAVGSDLPPALEQQQANAKPSLQSDTLTVGAEAGQMRAVPAHSSPDLAQMISEAAYYRAEKRGFSPGYEMEDWIAAEIELHARLREGDKNASLGIGG
jgi:Protein of unknown function (DUF2934)